MLFLGIRTGTADAHTKHSIEKEYMLLYYLFKQSDKHIPIITNNVDSLIKTPVGKFSWLI